MIDSVNIPKIIKSKSTGDNNSVAQVFAQNQYVKINPKQSAIFEFKYPVYAVEGATYNYYAQNTRTLKQNVDLGHTYTLVFSDNVISLTGATQVKHEIYRVTYEDYIEALNNPGGTAFTQTIVRSLQEPLVTFTENGSGTTGVYERILGNRYSFAIPNLFKAPGQYTQDIFRDKSQYFINTKFVFQKPVDRTIGDIQVYQVNENGDNLPTRILDYYKTEYDFVESSLKSHVITGETPFSGLTVNGAFITFFTTPKKPNLYVSKGDESINIIGKQKTFSPTFNFSNVDDGDYYRVMVTYDVNDTKFKGGQRIERLINKQNGDAEYVRTFSTPLLPNKQFLYKIGNTKRITSIFGTKQEATVWSEPIQAETANDGQFALSGYTYLDNISSGTTLSGCTLELVGVYSNSTIDLFVDTKNTTDIFQTVSSTIDNSSTFGNSIITVSDANGYFDFGRVDGGTYTLKVTPPSEYAEQLPILNRQVSISVDTGLEIVLTMIFGNTIVTWGSSQYVFL